MSVCGLSVHFTVLQFVKLLHTHSTLFCAAATRVIMQSDQITWCALVLFTNQDSLMSRETVNSYYIAVCVFNVLSLLTRLIASPRDAHHM